MIQLTRNPADIYERILDKIFLNRIFMHYPFAAILLLGGYYSISRSPGFHELSFIRKYLFINLPNGRLFVSFILFFIMMGGTYILNQIVDRESDRINRKNFFISDGHISINSAVIQLIFQYLITITAVFYLSLIGFFKGGILYFLVFLLSVIFGIMYSLPPIRLNAKPGLDMLANAIGYGLLNFSAGYLALGVFSNDIIKIAIPLTIIGLGGFGSTTIADIPGDKLDGKISIGVLIGERNTYILSIILFFIAAVTSLIINNPFTFIASVIPIPFQIWAMIKKGRRAALISMRVSNAPLVIISFLMFPIYFIGFIIIFLLTRIYYKKRFKLTYPSLSK